MFVASALGHTHHRQQRLLSGCQEARWPRTPQPWVGLSKLQPAADKLKGPQLGLLLGKGCACRPGCLPRNLAPTAADHAQNTASPHRTSPCLPGRGRPAPITVGLPWVAASSLISMEVKNEMLTPPSSSGLWDILDIWGPWEAHDGHR